MKYSGGPIFSANQIRTGERTTREIHPIIPPEERTQRRNAHRDAGLTFLSHRVTIPARCDGADASRCVDHNRCERITISRCGMHCRKENDGRRRQACQT